MDFLEGLYRSLVQVLGDDSDDGDAIQLVGLAFVNYSRMPSQDEIEKCIGEFAEQGLIELDGDGSSVSCLGAEMWTEAFHVLVSEIEG